MARYWLAALAGLIGCREDGDNIKVDPKPDTQIVNGGDEDGDGFTTDDGDCDDLNPDVNPSATEICNDLDDNCNSETDEGLGQIWYQDADGDGYGDAATATTACYAPDGSTANSTDCDDGDGTVYPGAPEACTDQVDRNCDGSIPYADADGDGFAACEECDDANAAVNPAAQEICDSANTDEDCDGLYDDFDDSVDPASQILRYVDSDGDGYGDDATGSQSCDGAGVEFGGDCNDRDAGYYPGALEVDCADPNDYNCDGSVGLTDSDGDGYAACQECDDASAATYPGATEICDSSDNNCNGAVDEGVELTWYNDADADGWGDDGASGAGCVQPPGTSLSGGDCDDGASGTYPGADESCDGIDQDCDGVADNDPIDGSTWYDDLDLDGYGDPATAQVSCGGIGQVADSTDCDDADASVNPGEIEVCDGLDNDCSGAADDGATDATAWYLDSDGDGWGDDATALTACDQPAGYVIYGGDCDDTDPAWNPAAIESDCADPNDYNCDGSAGSADNDGDGWAACEECNDRDSSTFPGASEVCDGADNNCDGAIDEGATLLWYADADADGYGDASVGAEACAAPAGYVADDQDCDDADPAINPAAAETCDGRDQDCDGLVDDNASDATTWYADGDRDGYGDPSAPVISCGNASLSADGSDCDDGDAAINPAALEVCDGVDNDCSGVADDNYAADALVWYLDSDGDGYGDAASTLAACDQPAGYAATGDDCNDADAAYNPGAIEADCADPNDYNCDGSAGSVDNDGDGYAACQECDDGNSRVHPGATEICDGADNDCDGATDEGLSQTWYADADADGWGGARSVVDCAAPAGYIAQSGDCDDSAASVNPGGIEVCDGLDNDCDGVVDGGAADASWWYSDADGDGYGDPAVALAACSQPAGTVSDDTDCDDGDAASHPSAVEFCDGADNNCDGTADNGAVDASTWYVDGDADGWGGAATVSACTAPAGYAASAGDCDDADAAYHPGAVESCSETRDLNCDGSVGFTDADGDGFAACAECDDGDALTYPGAVELCDGADNDCDGAVDDGAIGGPTWYADTDGDGFGDPAAGRQSCAQPSGYVAAATDCDDADALTYPGADEWCDGADNDCDGTVDDGALDAPTWYLDSDGDGYGDPAATLAACTIPVGYSAYSTDCNDSSAAFYPGAPESCSSLNDLNCDGSVGSVDNDGDGVIACDDCDDSDAGVYPGANEYCNSVDDNCDGRVDEISSVVDAVDWYQDNDGDGWGGAATRACSQPPGTVGTGGDCDDADAASFPGGTEVCDGLDNDCDGTADDNAVDASDWYADADGDGYGDPAALTAACDQPVGTVGDATDCDDADPTSNPGGTEVCDGADNDCDGTVDDSPVDIQTWYRDADGDGFGLTGSTVAACTQPVGYAAAGGDCDDSSGSYYPGAPETCTDPVDYNCDGSVGATDADGDGYPACVECDDGDAAVNPGATEACNGYDDDCDGSVDEAGATGELTWYLDSDGDGYGVSTATRRACSQPSGYVGVSTDCNDSRAAVNPAATEQCNGYDDDCDGASDEAGAVGETTWYYDADGDGYGGTTTVTACTAPSRYVATGGDCNDSGTAINPAASDVCDTVDNDCDGLVDNDGLCPCTVVNNAGSVYMFCTNSENWSNAGLACDAYGYDLVSLNNSTENTFVTDTAWSYINGRWWSGGNDRVLEGAWTWQAGDAWSYSNWRSGSPVTRANNNNDCVEIGGYSDYTWTDQGCTRQSPYVCEAP